MFRRAKKIELVTERLILRLPQHSDFASWADLRSGSSEFLQPWEPTWSPDHLTRRAFTNRVHWARRSQINGAALALFLTHQTDQTFLGAITLDNIRRGPAQSGTFGYWIGAPYARQGYMSEALEAVRHYAFQTMDLSRLEAACLPENLASRGLLERCGFKYEGVFQSYLQINGRWRNHVLYSCLRRDRRGRTDVG